MNLFEIHYDKNNGEFYTYYNNITKNIRGKYSKNYDKIL